MKAIAIIGYHHTGKTTAAVALISALKARGYKVASIKDIHSEAYRADKEGSNSAKHAAAGSSAVFARGLYDSALILPRSQKPDGSYIQPDLAEIISYLKADWLVIEGMKDAPVPKIVCAETTEQLDELIDETTIGISGLIAGELESYKELPVFCLHKQHDAFVETVLRRSFEILPCSPPECCSACGKDCYQMACDIVQGRAKRNACVQDNAKELILKIAGEELAIVPFVQKLLKDSILSFVHNLKGVDKAGSIEISINPLASEEDLGVPF